MLVVYGNNISWNKNIICTLQVMVCFDRLILILYVFTYDMALVCIFEYHQRVLSALLHSFSFLAQEGDWCKFLNVFVLQHRK